MSREASHVLSPPQMSCESSVIADARRIRDEFFNTIGQQQSFGVATQAFVSGPGELRRTDDDNGLFTPGTRRSLGA